MERKQKPKRAILYLFISMTWCYSFSSGGKHLGKISAQKNCENFVATNNDPVLNKEIAFAAKEFWENYKFSPLSARPAIGPFGQYIRHVFTDKTSLVREGYNNEIVRKMYYVKVLVKSKKGICKLAWFSIDKVHEGNGSYSAGFIYPEVQENIGTIDCSCADNVTDWLAN